MNNEKYIDDILNDLLNRGCNIEYLQDLKDSLVNYTNNSNNLYSVMNSIAEDIKYSTEVFLNARNVYSTKYISAISSCVYLPDYRGNGEYKLKVIGGTKGRGMSEEIDDNTMFDIASITKLFLLVLLFKLEELGMINLDDKITDLNPDFPYLEDFTFNDLIRLHGELRTDGNITKAKSQEEAYDILKTVYLVSNSREENKYTDFGAIVISETLEKLISKELGIKMNFQDIMNKFLLEPLGLKSTMFNPDSYNISGNGNNKKVVHDPKARILGGAVGSAGLFTTNDDLASLAKHLYEANYTESSYINSFHLNKLSEQTFPNSIQNNKGNLGIYIKHPLGYPKTFTPPEFSNGSFSHQGWTGSVAVFDPNNLIHNSILVNAIYESDDLEKIKNNKPIDFNIAFRTYQKELTKNSLLLYATKQYYNKYCNTKEDIIQLKKVK